MAEDQEFSESVKIAHLTMLQGVISRMGSNSFTLKALSATFGSAAVAVMATAQDPSPYYAAAAIVPMVIFWLMDAQFLKYERAYRTLYERVRKGEDIEAYSLNAEPFMADTGHVIRIALSWSISWFYAAIFVLLGAVALLIFQGGTDGGSSGCSDDTKETAGLLLVPLPERHLARESGSKFVAIPA